MKKWILLVGIFIALPIYGQSFFNGGDTEWGMSLIKTEKPEIVIYETVFKDILIESHKATIEVEKITKGIDVSYDVNFFASDKTLEYKGGYIKIYDFDVKEIGKDYIVGINYLNNVGHYETRSDFFHGDEYEVFVYDSTKEFLSFVIEK